MEQERATGSAFGKLLRRHRLLAGLTQEALAERARMSAVGVGALERGDRQAPYRATVELLAEALGLSAEAMAEFHAAAARAQRPRAPDRQLAAVEDLPRHNLPQMPTRFLGRERELTELRGLLDAQRLVTLTGTGGIGKTRAALQVAAEFVDCKDDGVWFVNFAPLSDPALVPNIVASALGIPVSGQRPIAQTLIMALRRRRILIVLDNCEQVVGAAADLAHSLVLDCPQVNLLVTSREPLNTAGERVYRLPSLEVPPDAAVTAASGETYSAVALFVARAQAADGRFALTDASAPIVADIVRRLDGIPLAIELAAARVGSLGLQALADRLDQRFRLLTTGNRTAMPRHQTLRAAFDWSYELLSKPERVLFRRLAIFAGGWTLEAAEDVCSHDQLDAADIVDVLGSLVDKSLVVADDDGRYLRYRLLESSRAYALEKLAESGERMTLAAAHAQWVGTFVERVSERGWTESLRPWLVSVEPEADNLRAALAWAMAAGHFTLVAQMVSQLDRFWFERAPAEGRRWVEAAFTQLDSATEPLLAGRLFLSSAGLSNANRKIEAAQSAIALLETAGDSRTRAWAQSRLATGLIDAGRFEEASTAIDRALQLYEDAGMARTRRFITTLLARALVQSGQHRLDDARISCAAALALGESLGDEEETARARTYLAEVEFNSGDARRALELVLQVNGRAGLSTRAEAAALINSAAYLIALGEAARARALARTALTLLRRAHLHQHFAAGAILQLAAALALQGDARPAARLLGFADAWTSREGFEWATAEAKSYETLVTALRTHLPADTFIELTAAGAQLDVDQAIDEALAAPET